MKFVFILAAVFVVGVTSAPAPDTGLVGRVGYDVVGNLGEGLWQAGDKLQVDKKAPLNNAIGGVLKAGGNVVVLAGDEVGVGGAVGDVVTTVGTAVEKIGDGLKGTFLGDLLGPLLKSLGLVVQTVGGDPM